MAKRESSIEAHCRGFILDLGGEFFKLTSINGIPDRLVLLPGGLIMFAEFKRKDKKPRKLQAYAIRMLRSMGFNAGYYDDETAFKIEVFRYMRENRSIF